MGEEFLSGGITVLTSEAHTFGTDAFLLADFARPARDSLCCDLGTGCGIIPLLWARRREPLTVYGIDLQEEAVVLFDESIRRCTPEGEYHAVRADLRELPPELPKGRFGLVTCNPPYTRAGGGIPSGEAAARTARHETECTLEDVCAAAARLLRFGGRFCICQRPERLADAVCAMRASRLEPKRLRLVSREAGSPPWLFLLEGRRGGKPSLKVEPQMCVYENGTYTPEMAALYK